MVFEAEHDVAFGRGLSEREMQSAARATPSLIESPGYFWPLSVRQWRAPVRTVKSMARFCRSTCRARLSVRGA